MALVAAGLLGRSLSVLPVGTWYAVWTGIGAAGTGIMGVVLFGENLDLLRLAGVALVVADIVTRWPNTGRRCR
jgi:quaternary ammonium compound-resistance protein SugE